MDDVVDHNDADSRKRTLGLVQLAGLKHPSYLPITYLIGINKSKIEGFIRGP